MRTRESYYLVWFLACALAWAGKAGAEDYFVSTVDEFNVAVWSAGPGDTITLASGSWNNADLRFAGAGTADRPITLRAQRSGQVFLTGASRLHLAGEYLVAQGLVFTNGFPQALDVIEFATGPMTFASNCRVTDCAIINFNPTNPITDTKWVSLYGYSNRVDHCYFAGKTNVGTLLIVWLPPANGPQALTPNYHLIDQNYFGLRPRLASGNGGEIIRVGDSSTCFNRSHTIVERNYFQRCDGEIEIVSSKSCENVYRYNTFMECAGTLTLRHGNGCQVEGNYFFGNNKASTGGVRVIGEDHRVINNYFQDLAGSAGYSALVLMQGLENSPLNGYFQVKNADLAFNTLVRCANSLVVGLEATYSQSGTNRTTTLPPLDCAIANNIVLATRNKLVDQRIAPINLTWLGNIMFGTSLGLGPTPGILLADPILAQATDGIWRPQPGSPALGSAQGGFSFVTDDIRGRIRPPAKDVGSDQANGSPPLRKVLSSADVGPSWMQPLRTSLGLVSRQSVVLRWPTVSGAVQQVQRSADLVMWANAGAPLTASNSTQRWEELQSPSPDSPPVANFYRVKQISGPNPPIFSLAIGMTNRPCLSLGWNAIPGAKYQVQVSTNLTIWSDIGSAITNTATFQRWEEAWATGRAKFYRVKQLAD